MVNERETQHAGLLVKKNKRKNVSPPPEPPAPRTCAFRVSWLAVLLIVIVAFLIYAPVLRGPFIWDDELLIQNNLHVTSPGQVGRLFSDDVEASGGKKGALYRPLTMLTFALDYSLWRLNPVGYHVVNVFWHVAASLAFFYLAFLLFGSVVPAFIASLLFAVHPVHTEAVSYISGRSDPVSVFLLLSVLIVILRQPFSRRANLAAVIVLYAACLLSRESGLVLPGLVLLYYGAFGKKIDRLSFGGLLAVAAAYGVMRVTALSFLLPHASGHGSLASRLPGFFVAFLHYLRLLVWPADLHMEYGTVFFRLSDPQAVAGLLLFLAACGLLAYAWRRSRLVAFGLGWFLVGLLPFSNLFPVNAYMAEHWLYLPSLGVFLAAAFGLHVLYQDPRFKKVCLGVTAALAAFYGSVTFIHNAYWSDTVSFYERTFAYAPYSWRVANNLGTTYQEKGDLAKAEAYLLKALALKPDNQEAYNNLGVVYSKARRPEDAIAHLEKALALDPKYVEAYRNLGNTYRKLGRREEAKQAYEKALSVRPDYALAYAGLGNLAQDDKDFVEAARLYKKALDVDPGCVEAYNNLGVIQQKEGGEKALDYYLQAVERDPTNADAYSNLALAYQQAGRQKEALAAYQRLFELDPGHAAGRNNLGNLYQSMGNAEDAIASYEKALESDPENADACFNLGNMYRQAGRLDDAVAMYTKAVASRPESTDACVNLGAVYQMSGKMDLAAEAYGKALKIDPASLEATMNLALIAQGRGDIAGAQAYYEKALALQPGNASIYNNIGLMRQGQKDDAGAEAMYRKAIEVDPGYAQAYNNLAILCMASGRSEEAFNILKKSVVVDPKYGQGYNNLAVYCHGQENYVEARRYLEKAKSLGFPVDPQLEAELKDLTE